MDPEEHATNFFVNVLASVHAGMSRWLCPVCMDFHCHLFFI